MFAQQTTIKIATIAPESSSWMKDMRAGAEAIENATEGRVKFKFYGGGVQGNDKQVQRKMRTGQLHGGAFSSGGLNRFQKDADIFALPMLFNTIDEARYIRGELEPVIRQRLEEAGYVEIEKSFLGRKPLTRARLTRAGRRAFAAYLEAMKKLVGDGSA